MPCFSRSFPLYRLRREICRIVFLDVLRFPRRHMLHFQRRSQALYVEISQRHVAFAFGAPCVYHLRSFPLLLLVGILSSRSISPLVKGYPMRSCNCFRLTPL